MYGIYLDSLSFGWRLTVGKIYKLELLGEYGDVVCLFDDEGRILHDNIENWKIIPNTKLMRLIYG